MVEEDNEQVLEAKETEAARLALQRNHEGAISAALDAYEKKEKKVKDGRNGDPLAITRNIQHVGNGALPELTADEEKKDIPARIAQEAKDARLVHVEVGKRSFTINKPFHKSHDTAGMTQSMRREKISEAWEDLQDAMTEVRKQVGSVTDVDDRTGELKELHERIRKDLDILGKLGATLDYAKAEESWSKKRIIGRAADVMELVPVKRQQVFFMDALRAAEHVDHQLQNMLKAVDPLVASIRLQKAVTLVKTIGSSDVYDHVLEKLSTHTEELADAIAKKGDATAKLTPEQQESYASVLVYTIRAAVGEVIGENRKQDEDVLTAAADQWYSLRAEQLETVLKDLSAINGKKRIPDAIKLAVGDAILQTQTVVNILKESEIPVDISNMKQSFAALEKAYEAAKWRMRGEAVPLLGRVLETQTLNKLSTVLGRAEALVDNLEEDRLSCRLAIAEAEVMVVQGCIGDIRTIRAQLSQRGHGDIEVENGETIDHLLEAVLKESGNVKFAVPDSIALLHRRLNDPFEGVAEATQTRLRSTSGWAAFETARARAVKELEGFTQNMHVNRDQNTDKTVFTVDKLKEALKEVERMGRKVAEEADGFHVSGLGQLNLRIGKFHPFRKTVACLQMESLVKDIGGAARELDDAVTKKSEQTLDERLVGYDASAKRLIDLAVDTTDRIASELEERENPEDRQLLKQVRELNEKLQNNKDGMDTAGGLFKK